MSNSTRTCGTVATLVGLTAALTATVAPQRAAAQNTYSPVLVQQYNLGCVHKLHSKGFSEEKAQSACQCSLKNLQAEMNQHQAILFLTTAQFSAIDASTGMPKKLSPFFSSCLA